MGLSEITLQLIAFRVLALLILAAVQGGIVAGTAVLLGDKGPEYDGRLTIVPGSHIDLVGAISLMAFGLGWSRPVAIDPRQFRIGRMGLGVVILTGFVGLLVLAALLNALILPALTALPLYAGLTAAAFFRAASNMSIWFALLCLLPFPPLTGGVLLSAVGIRVSRQTGWILTALLFVAVATGVVRQLLGPVHTVLARLILGA